LGLVVDLPNLPTPTEKVIEYLLEAEDKQKRLIDMTCKGFAEETASESPAPGGGSVAAYMGALGAALGTMVANLSSHKAGWDDRWEEFSDWADRGQALLGELLHLVDEDTAAFNRIMAVFAMPKSTDEEKAARSAALQEATLYASQVPLRTMKTASGFSKSCVPWQPSATPTRCPTRASGRWPPAAPCWAQASMSGSMPPG